ncbi:MAG: hypothetical protein AAFQ09_12120 [Pseudomonadota bacterium]
MQNLPDIGSGLSKQHHDYLLMTVYVFAQHADYDRAKQIIDGMLALGLRSGQVLISQAVLEFFSGNFDGTLRCLDKMEKHDADITKHTLERDRMLRFLRARCLYAIGQEAKAENIAAQLAAH